MTGKIGVPSLFTPVVISLKSSPSVQSPIPAGVMLLEIKTPGKPME
ncbi:MAG: hypothetical protein ACNA7V_03820 [Bacteroidales bacterium]